MHGLPSQFKAPIFQSPVRDILTQSFAVTQETMPALNGHVCRWLGPSRGLVPVPLCDLTFQPSVPLSIPCIISRSFRIGRS